MNILLWVLQVLAALLYGGSGVMKVVMFDKISEGVVSFGASPREVWKTLGILELVCSVGLIVPAALRWQPALTLVAAAVLTMESLVFIWMHAKYREMTPINLSGGPLRKRTIFPNSRSPDQRTLKASPRVRSLKRAISLQLSVWVMAMVLPGRIRVLSVEDHPVFREGLSTIISSQQDRQSGIAPPADQSIDSNSSNQSSIDSPT
jgi:uncharacterized membrane protein YphA (DoxX/SURF4 family)